MSRQAVTLWTGEGATKAFEDHAARALLDLARPQIIRLHTGPTALASDGAKLTEKVRAAYPDAEVWWALAGDAHGPDPTRVWVRAAQAAVAAGVGVLELNCEQAWKTRPRGTARRAVDATHAAAPSLALGHTAYDGPLSVVTSAPGAKPVRRWGGHSVYPWQEFLGAGSPVAFSSPQVYWASAGGETKARGAGAERLRNHRASWAAAVRAGKIRADLPVHGYLQSYGCRTDELVAVGEAFAVTSWWATPTRLRPEGVAAIHALAELHRRGQSVAAFQRAAGLVADGLCGPKTLAALLAP
jgi:hypothetical protein